VNASEYISGEVTDFAEVGVEAVDDYTRVYTLEAPCSYFLTMLGYNVFAPMSRTYYESQGGKFGMEYDSSAADYNYGKSADTIAYCGPYLVTGHTEQNSIVFSANPTYWNADALNIQSLTWKYDDGSDPTKLYNDFLNGTVDAVGLTSSILELAKSDGYFDDYASVSGTDATTFFNMYTNRANAFKQSIEGALDGQIIINMVDGSDYSGWYYANYYNTYGYEQNSDINDTTGWGPDYGDPSTYLDTLLPDYAGYMTKGFGIF